MQSAQVIKSDVADLMEEEEVQTVVEIVRLALAFSVDIVDPSLCLFLSYLHTTV